MSAIVNNAYCEGMSQLTEMLALESRLNNANTNDKVTEALAIESLGSISLDQDAHLGKNLFLADSLAIWLG